MRRLTIAWGCWFAVQAVGRASAVQLLDVPTFLATWPFVSAVGTIAMILWSFNVGQRGAGATAWDPAELGGQLGEAAQHALDRAVEEAKHYRHPYVGTEHLLIAIAAGDDSAARALRNVRVTRETARATLETLVDPGTTPPWQEPRYAPRLRSALQRAVDLRQADGTGDDVATDHLLVGLIDEPDGQAVHLLGYMGIDLAALRRRLVAGPDVPAPEAPG
jgi:hypothetical protein